MEPDLKKQLNKLYKDNSREDLILMLLTASAREQAMRPKKVVIEASERERIMEIMRVFGPYIEEHYYFDFFWSSKFGVVRLDIEGDLNYFSDADSFFSALVYEIFNDVRDLKIGGDHIKTAMRPEEGKELQRRVLPLLNELHDKDHYSEILKDFIIEESEKD